MKLGLQTRNTKTEFTRMCIAEAIIDMLQEDELSKIRISAVVQRAGVSRMTFYNYYHSITEALEDYVQILVALYVEECLKQDDIGGYLDYEHILFALKFFDQYRRYFTTMNQSGLYGILIKSVNQFMEEQFSADNPYSTYEMYSYAGGLLNAFLMWEENGKKESAEDIAALLHKLYTHRKAAE